jgi:hypothetical protein
MTSCTRDGLRALRASQEGRPEGTLLAVADGQPEHFALALLGQPVAMTMALLTTEELS